MKEMKREKESGRKNPVDSQRTKNEERGTRIKRKIDSKTNECERERQRRKP